MNVIVPVSIAEAALLSSSIAEDDHPAWASGTTYAAGARAIKAHRIWESAQAGNTNHEPTTDDGTWWLDAGPTNRWAMFDDRPSTASTGAGSITVTLRPGAWVNALALVSVVCSTARVQVIDADDITVLYDRTQHSTSLSRSSWHGWFMRERFTAADDLVFDDLPRRVTGSIVVTLTGPGTVSLGVLAVGVQHAFGVTQAEAESDIVDYSRVLIDDFGDVQITRRGTSRRVRYQLYIDTPDLPRVRALRERVASLPCVWAGTDQASMRSALLAYGLATRMPIVVRGPVQCLCSLEVQGFA